MRNALQWQLFDDQAQLKIWYVASVVVPLMDARTEFGLEAMSNRMSRQPRDKSEKLMNRWWDRRRIVAGRPALGGYWMRRAIKKI